MLQYKDSARCSGQDSTINPEGKIHRKKNNGIELKGGRPTPKITMVEQIKMYLKTI